MKKFPYRSYCWSLGTTSFRTTDFNVRIERQLALLSEFRAANDGAWRDLQSDYYRFMQERGFVKGNAPNPAKDAREKTSGLVDIGLVDSERNLTAAGRALLTVAENSDFGRDNPLQIPNDSFIYLKQLLKMSVDIDSDVIRPFVLLSRALSRFEYLSNDEFTYLLPLCTNAANTKEVFSAMESLRSGNSSLDDIVKARLMAMENYKAALDYFLVRRVTESVITAVGMNRKSGGAGEKAYDKPYFLFYKTLRDIVFNRNGDAVLSLYEQSQKIKNKPGVLWRQYLFNTAARNKLTRDGLKALNDVPLLRTTDEREFKRLFFEQMHLFKARANLSDYADLNRRYFKTTDAVIFADGKVEFDVLSRCWLNSIADDLSDALFETAHHSDEPVPTWYDSEIAGKLRTVNAGGTLP